jgi:iron complex outermembrane receptor protein
LPFDPATPTVFQYDTRKTIRQNQVGANWRHDFGDAGMLRESQLSAYGGSRGVTQWQAIPICTQIDCTAKHTNVNAAKQSGGVVDFDRRYGGVEGKLTLQFGATDLVLGLNAETQEDDRQGYENFTGVTITPPTATATALGVTGKLRRDETNRAATREAFAQAHTPLAGGWDLTGGLRGGQVKMSTRDRYISGVNGDDSGDLDFSYLNPALGLRWSPAPEWALHASAARGFESPTLGELAYSPTPPPGSVPGPAGGFNANLKGQTSRQIEFGAKWRSAVLELDAALFNADTENEISVLSNSGGRSVFQNAGRTRRYGAELAGLWRPARDLRLRAAATWLHASYRDSFLTCTTTPCASANVTVAAGNRIAGTQSASGWAEAAWRPGLVPGELAVEWRAVSSTMANDINTARAAGYALAHLRWSGNVPLGATDAIELLARVDNLFDRAYVGSVIVNDGNQRYYEPGAPRSALLSLRWLHRW